MEAYFEGEEAGSVQPEEYSAGHGSAREWRAVRLALVALCQVGPSTVVSTESSIADCRIPAKKSRSGVKRESGTTYSTSASSSRRSNRKIVETDDDGDTAMDDGDRVKSEHRDPRYGSSDEDGEDEEGPRVDIERINLISDDEGDEDAERGRGNGTARSNWGLKPVRLDRKEHRERGVGVSTDTSSTGTAKSRRKSGVEASDDDSLFIPLEYLPEGSKGKGKERNRDVQFLRDERRWRGVYQDDDADTAAPSMSSLTFYRDAQADP